MMALLLIPFSKWEDLTQDKDVIEVLKEVYGDEVEELHIMAGLMVEEKIKGFAMSKTTLFIFQLMASRRLEADRFFTSECNEETYTKKGLEWVNTTESLKDVLDCHYPEIPKKWINSTSAFSVWDSPKFNVVSTKVVMIKTSVKKEPKIMKGNGARHNLLKSCEVKREIENVIIIDFPKSVGEDLQGIMQGSSGSRRGKLFFVINIDHDEYVKMDGPEFCVECGGDFNCDASSRKSCFVYDFQRKYTGLDDDDCWFIEEKKSEAQFSYVQAVIFGRGRFMKGPHSGDSNQEFSQALFGMMLANPTLLYMLLLEKVAAMGSPIWWDVKNVLTVAGYNALVVCFFALCHSYDNTFKFCAKGFGVAIYNDYGNVSTVFKWIQQVGNIEGAEMRQTFNMGINMVLVGVWQRSKAKTPPFL
ncbi:hypothetical protein V6N12_003077 [Hibiscus sabdariffa]|uniref:Uncharacterized protein n=1 Tax=Hibiscus sabdariffa TaxID=183260 RepID=A0ABR2EAV2_9ROSI